MVRVPTDVLSKLREILPEFRDESDANLVRVALRKLIYEYEQERMLPRKDYEKQFFKVLAELQKRKTNSIDE